MPNPHCEEAAHWDAALEAYHEDRVVDAWSEIVGHGVGEAGRHIRWYRLIEAESILRLTGTQTRISDWLTLETIPAETLSSEQRLGHLAIQSADLVASCLGWTHGQPILLSILSKASEAPWATNPHGYWVNKDPYDKICLPFYLLDDETDFQRAVAHEYAHVVCDGLSSEHAPTWLHEAISVSAELLIDGGVRECTPSEWRSPQNLERLLDSEANDVPEAVLEGYRQCGWIGSFLYSQGGPKSLGQLLKEHGNESVWRNLLRVIRGKERVDSAVYRVYGLTVEQLFMGAEAHMIAESR